MVAFHFGRTGGWGNQGYDCKSCKTQGLYQSRNCSKYFPDQPHNPTYKWEPSYQTSKGEFYFVPDVSCTECPISFITPASLELIQLDVRQRLAKESTGASLYGSDLSRWSSRIVDAFVVIEGERNRAEVARQEAEYGS